MASSYDDTAGPNRYDSFHVYTTSYKRIGDNEIQVGILVPKHIVFGDGKNPLFVKFHGGGLVSIQGPTRRKFVPLLSFVYKVSGTWDYPNWYAKWLVPLVHRNDAVAVLPNYRLLPEHSGRARRDEGSEAVHSPASKAQAEESATLTLHGCNGNVQVSHTVYKEHIQHADVAWALAHDTTSPGGCAMRRSRRIGFS